MTKHTIARCFSVVLIAASLETGALAQGAATMGEGSMRQFAKATPKPGYPPGLVSQKITGVAVASIIVGVDGRVETVIVLEAPDPLMADAVRNAVQQWTFGVVRSDDQALRVASKLTFYFQIRNGAGVVLNPEEMPGGRPLAAKTVPPPSGKRPPPPSAPPGVMRASDHNFSHLEIDEAEFRRRMAAGTTVVLDARDRDAFRQGHRDGALNIPRDELEIRAPIEIPAGKAVVVDCSRADDFTCMMGASRLTDAKFRVSVIRR